MAKKVKVDQDTIDLLEDMLEFLCSQPSSTRTDALIARVCRAINQSLPADEPPVTHNVSKLDLGTGACYRG